METKLFNILCVLMLVFGLVAVIYKGVLMNDCIKSNNPNSKECFRYNVLNDSMRNVNVTGDFK